MNVSLSVFVASLAGLGGLAATAAVLDISDDIKYIDHYKSSSV